MSYSGKVTHRRTGAALANIPVSDGRNTVYTDENGCFTLEGWERAHVINVGILTTCQNDWFIYIEDRITSYNFVIEPAAPKDDFCILHISDTEIDKTNFTDRAVFLRNMVKKYSPSLFLHTGDICNEDGLKRHVLIMNSETMGCPVRYCIGNHDMTAGAYGEELYERIYGPSFYSFDYGNYHFASISMCRGNNIPSGYLPEDQWIWLQNDLAAMDPSKKLVMFGHDDCFPDPIGFCPTVNGVSVDLRSYGVMAWIHGHMHVNYANDEGGVYNIGTSRPDCGGVDSSVAGVRRISFTDGVISSDIHYFRQTESAPATEYEWQTQLDGRVIFSYPTFAEGKIFVGTADDGIPKKCGVYAVDAEDGKIIWSFPAKNTINSAIRYENGKIYMQDTQGRVYCLSAADGSIVWEADAADPHVRYKHGNFSVFLAGDLLIAGFEECVSAFNKETGELVWCESKHNKSEGTPAKQLYDEKRGQLLISRHWNALCALDVKDGAEKWHNEDVRFRTSTPLIVGDIIYAVRLNSAYELSAETGETLRVVDTGNRLDVGGAPAFDGKTLFYPSVHNGVVAIDVETFTVKCYYQCGPTGLCVSPYAHGEFRSMESTPIVEGEELVFTALDGGLYRYNIESGELISKSYAGAPIIVSPVITDDAVYTADFDGRLTKFKK